MIPYSEKENKFTLVVLKEQFSDFVTDCFNGDVRVKYFFTEHFNSANRILEVAEQMWEQRFYHREDMDNNNIGYFYFLRTELGWIVRKWNTNTNSEETRQGESLWGNVLQYQSKNDFH